LFGFLERVGKSENFAIFLITGLLAGSRGKKCGEGDGGSPRVDEQYGERQLKGILVTEQ
jgi:hypothetical protein